MTTIAIIGLGAMGSAIAQLLVENGARAITLLEGRSEGTVARARLVGVAVVAPAEILNAEIILSVVPPSQAIATAELIREIVGETTARPAIST